MNKKIISLIAIGLGTLIFVGLAVYISYDLNYYFFYDQSEKSNWAHPLSNILLFISFMIFEASILAAIIATPKPGRLWIKGIIGLIILIPWVCYSTMFVVHMPGYVLVHHLWAWITTISVVGVTLSSAIANGITSIRRRKQRNA